MLADQIQGDVRDQFAGGQRRAEAGLQRASRCTAAPASDRQPGGRQRPRQGKELQHRGGDDAQRSFGADEQVLQVVAGVVLAQAAQAIPDLAAGQHHFQAQGQFARVAVAQDLHAAGIGRQIAADLATALGGQRQRKQASCACAAASCSVCSTQPASTVIVLFAGSIARTRLSATG
jgi:hypothetical protein